MSTQSNIDPPAFQLPDDFYTNRARYELWSVRAPVKFDAVKSLDGSKIRLSLEGIEEGRGSQSAISTSSVPGSLISSTFDVDGTPHGFALGHSVESDSFRILVVDDANERDGDDSSDGSDDEGGTKSANSAVRMKPLPTPFDRHVNIVESGGENMRDTDLAPSAERAHALADNVTIRLAYDRVPQVTGLKRRWAMKGGTRKVGNAMGGVPASAKVEDEDNTKKRRVDKDESPATPDTMKKSSSKKKDRSSSKKNKKKKEKKKA